MYVCMCVCMYKLLAHEIMRQGLSQLSWPKAVRTVLDKRHGGDHSCFQRLLQCSHKIKCLKGTRKDVTGFQRM